MERRAHLLGWGLFLLGCILFLASGVRNNDPLSVAGGLLFTVGVLLFIVPLARRRGR